MGCTTSRCSERRSLDLWPGERYESKRRGGYEAGNGKMRTFMRQRRIQRSLPSYCRSARRVGKMKCSLRGRDEVEWEAEASKPDGDLGLWERRLGKTGNECKKAGHWSWALLASHLCHEGHDWFHRQIHSICYSVASGRRRQTFFAT